MHHRELSYLMLRHCARGKILEAKCTGYRGYSLEKEKKRKENNTAQGP